VLIAILIYEASNRVNQIVNHGGYDMKPDIMIITASIGLTCNIINIIALGECSCKEDKDDDKVDLLNSITSIFKPNPLYYSMYRPGTQGMMNLRHNDRIIDQESPKFAYRQVASNDNQPRASEPGSTLKL